MSVTPNSKQILNARMQEINLRIDAIDKEMLPLQSQIDGAKSRLQQLRDERAKLNAIKQDIQTDTGA